MEESKIDGGEQDEWCRMGWIEENRMGWMEESRMDGAGLDGWRRAR